MLLLTDPPDLPPLPTRRSSDLGPNPSTDSYVIKGIAKLKNITALRVDALPHKSFPAGGQRLVRQRVHAQRRDVLDRKSTRLNSSHGYISYAVFCLKKKKYTKAP